MVGEGVAVVSQKEGPKPHTLEMLTEALDGDRIYVVKPQALAQE